MKKWLRPALAACFLLTVSMNPSTALTAAADSLHSWAFSVVPALLPFLMAAPALTCEEVSDLFGRALGSVLRILRLPAGCTGAVLIGLLSGSPGGAAALASSPRADTDPPGAFLRAAILASGASPAFLLSGVAAGMLNRPDVGWMLVRSQLIAAVLSVFALRSLSSRTPAAPLPPSPPVHHSVPLQAAFTLLTIAGYMVLFSVCARLLTGIFGPASETPLLAVLELAGGCRALSSLPFPPDRVLPLLSAAASFGGLSVYMQCMSFLAPMGISFFEYAAGKLLHSALSALLTHLQLALSAMKITPSFMLLLPFSCLLLLIMLRTILRWIRPSGASIS